MKNIISNFIKVTAIFAFLILGITSVYAQMEESIDEPVPWYQIELIVFEYTNSRNAETEIWIQQPGSPEQDLTLELMDSNSMLGATEVPEAFLLLDPKELLLTQEYNLIKNPRQRNPVLHVAWRQPASSENESISVRIHGGKLYSIQQEPEETSTSEAPVNFSNFLSGIFNNEKEADSPEDENMGLQIEPQEELLEQIDGSITISRARYLHVWTDFIYRLPSSDLTSITYDTDSENTYLENRDSIDFDSNRTSPKDTYEQPIASFRLQDHRRMRSKELHYIDHPLFGVIVMATPYELPEPPAEDPPAEEMISPEGTGHSAPALKTGKIKIHNPGNL